MDAPNTAPKPERLSITIDGTQYKTRDDDQEVAALIRLAGRDPEQTDLGKVEDGGAIRRLRDEKVLNLKDGDQFVTLPQSHLVVVNGQQFERDDAETSFDDVVRLAFPDRADGAEITFVVLYRKAAEPREGSLVAGQTVRVKDRGTVFNVTFTNKS